MKHLWDLSDRLSNEDLKFLKSIFYQLQQKGERWVEAESKEDGYTKHIRGLKAWLTRSSGEVEKFIFACWKLKLSFHDQQSKIFKLEKNLNAVAGSTELVDLGEIWDLRYIEGGAFEGIMFPKEHADRLAEAVKKIAKEQRRKGFEEGSNILQRLSNGDISVTNFETAREKSEE